MRLSPLGQVWLLCLMPKFAPPSLISTCYIHLTVHSDRRGFLAEPVIARWSVRISFIQVITSEDYFCGIATLPQEVGYFLAEGGGSQVVAAWVEGIPPQYQSACYLDSQEQYYY